LRQARRGNGARLHHVVAWPGKSRFLLRVRGNAQCAKADAQCPSLHCLLFSNIRPELESDGNMSTDSCGFETSTGRVVSAPRSSISRIASSIGMCTVPAFLSTHP